MGVEQPPALVLQVQVAQHRDEHGVLEHVGMVAGMEGVAVGEHAPMVPRPALTSASMPTLFDPIRIGDIDLATRIVMAPLTRDRAGPGQVRLNVPAHVDHPASWPGWPRSPR
jgi:hypothetical protein